MPRETVVVENTEIRSQLNKMKEKGMRLITVIADIKDGKLEISYALEKDEEVTLLRTYFGLEDEVPSVQDIYMNAMLYEMEIVDLFGVNIRDVPSGLFLEPEMRAPFRRDV